MFLLFSVRIVVLLLDAKGGLVVTFAGAKGQKGDTIRIWAWDMAWRLVPEHMPRPWAPHPVHVGKKLGCPWMMCNQARKGV